MSKNPIRKCGNCKHCMFTGWGGTPECCIDYEMACTEEEEIQAAADCPRYEYGIAEYLSDDHYTPSATNGDYSPGNPWDAPGMSIRDFI